MRRMLAASALVCRCCRRCFARVVEQSRSIRHHFAGARAAGWRQPRLRIRAWCVGGGGQVRDGYRCRLSRRRAGGAGASPRLLDGPDRGHQRAVRRIRRGHRLSHAGRARRASGQCARCASTCRLRCVPAARRARGHALLRELVGVSRLAPTGVIPDGPGSSTAGLEHHPVEHVAYEDALAYAKWKGRALPTEEQFELAAQGAGRKNAAGDFAANTWQGSFPALNTRADGFAGTSPWAAFEASRAGLYDLIRQCLGMGPPVHTTTGTIPQIQKTHRRGSIPCSRKNRPWPW